MATETSVGQELWSGAAVVDRSSLQRWGEATGAEVSEEVPPGLLLSLVPMEAVLAKVDAPGRRVLANEFQLEQLRPLRVGQPVRLRSRLADITVRPGALASTTFITCDDEGQDAVTGETVFRARRIFAVLPARGAA